jgi:hypothetical protein
MGGDEDVPEELAAAHPGWRIWRNGPVTYARWLGSSPPILLTDTTFERLGERIPLAVAAWEQTHSYWATLRAAGERKT